MNTISRNIAFSARNASTEALVSVMPPALAAAAQRQAHEARDVYFVEYMETAMTCVVLVGALLFAAGLALYGAKLGGFGVSASSVLYALASLGGVGLGIVTLMGIFQRVAPSTRRRG